MLTEDKIIVLYCIVDDILKGIGHSEDVRRKVSDGEVIVTAFVSALYFGGHQDNARQFMKMTKLIASMLSKGNFNRRLHAVSDLLFSLFYQLGHSLKAAAGASDYIVNSFPVAVCDNIRISRWKMLKGKQWRGRQASMRRYFYGVKVQVLTTGQGIPTHRSLPTNEAACTARTAVPMRNFGCSFQTTNKHNQTHHITNRTNPFRPAI